MYISWRHFLQAARAFQLFYKYISLYCFTRTSGQSPGGDDNADTEKQNIYIYNASRNNNRLYRASNNILYPEMLITRVKWHKNVVACSVRFCAAKLLSKAITQWILQSYSG